LKIINRVSGLEMEKFELRVEDSVLEDLHNRLNNARFPNEVNLFFLLFYAIN